MRISVSVEYQLPIPRPPISRLSTAVTSSTLPALIPGMVGSLEAWGDPGTGGAASGAGAGDAVVEAGAAGVEDEAGGVFDAGGVCWLVCGLFCPYPVKAKPGTNS